MLGLTFSDPLALLLLPLLLGGAAWLWLRDEGALSRARLRLALAPRLVILGALVLVLAGATWRRPETRQATVFVADLSASMGGLPDRETAFIARALRARRPDDAAAVVAVGAGALVEQPVAVLAGFDGFQSVVDRGATNLEAGLNLAGALFPTGYRKRVVLLTDGRQNTGDILQAARLLRAEGTRLDVVPLAPNAGPEALVTGVDAPTTLRRDERGTLKVDLRSTVAQAATLQMSADGRLLRSLRVALPAGDTTVSTTLPVLGPGYHSLRAVLEPTADTVAENDEGAALVHVRGAARVLVAEGAPGEGDIVAAALRARGMDVTREAAGLVQPSTAYLSGFDAVTLVDVPALDLDPALLDPQGSPLAAYVDGGGGLVVVGGPASYGVGGYAGTALESVLPVSMKLPRRKDTPSVAVALIVEDLETPSNVNISKAAGEGVVKLLTPADRVEVNDANGTDQPNGGWAVPLQYVTNKAAINAAIEAMRPADPMSYKPALQAAFNTLRRSGARIKHIILLGDGDAEDAYAPLVTAIRKAGVTVSTVATGAANGGFADYVTMQNIARWGGGRYYQSDNVAAIPQIFLKETKAIARTGIVEEHFVPDVLSASPILDGLPAAPLDGYVATTPKPLGQVVLTHVTRHGVDPVLAQWQYGLGRVVAWTSDARGRWTTALIRAAAGNRLWSNMVQWVLPPESSPNLSVASSIAGGLAHLTVTTNGLPLDAAAQAHVDGPAGPSIVALPPTAPGRYEGDVPATTPGAYPVTIQALVHGRARASLRTGLVVPYAPEYRATGLDAPLLAAAAAAGGGTALRDPAASFADNLRDVSAPRPLTTSLLLLALLLLPLDVAARRLLVGREDVRTLLAALARRRAGGPQSAAAVGAGTAAAPLSALQAHRAARQERVVDARAGTRDAAPTTPPSPSPGASAERVARRAATITASAPPPTAPARPRPEIEERVSSLSADQTTPTGEPTATSRLLEAKRRRRGG